MRGETSFMKKINRAAEYVGTANLRPYETNLLFANTNTFEDNFSNIRSGNQAFLFDTPVTEEQTKLLVSIIEDSLKLKVVGFVPNHWHSDCMGGLGWLQKKGIASYASQRTIDLAWTNHLPVPEYGFQDSLKLKLSDQTIECYYFGAAHTTDNIVVWIPSEKILFAGCIAKSMSSQSLGNTADGDLKAYPKTVRKVIAKFPDVQIVIPGHGPWGGVELLKHTLELAEQVKTK